NAEQPRLEVGAGLELIRRPQRPRIRLLYEVLGVRAVAAEIPREVVKRVGVGQCILAEPAATLVGPRLHRLGILPPPFQRGTAAGVPSVLLFPTERQWPSRVGTSGTDRPPDGHVEVEVTVPGTGPGPFFCKFHDRRGLRGQVIVVDSGG